VPNGSGDTATFNLSNVTSVSINRQIGVNSIVFTPGASAYTIDVVADLPLHGALTLTGVGITNSSGIAQHFDVGTEDSALAFRNNATAGSQTIFSVAAGSNDFVGLIDFYDNSSADHGEFTIEGGIVGAFLTFRGSSTADHGTFTVGAGMTLFDNGGHVSFQENSTAANGTFTANGAAASNIRGGNVAFDGNSTAGSATLIANSGSGGGLGGRIDFLGGSTGGTARVEVFGNGNLDISSHNAPGVTVGSIEGDGNVFLGANNLTVGSNNMSTTFSGVIQDGGNNGGTGGSLSKTGSGTLTLSGANTYTGGTAVNAGKLLVNGSITSAVTVNGGTLGGSGTTGAVTVNSGGTLSPGNSPGILHVAGNLSLSLGSTYLVELNGTAVGTQYDQTDVTGSVGLGNATLSLSLGFAPSVGTSFNIINNDFTDAVTGTFAGLPEGSTFVVGSDLLKISYVGGDGNDVVLTVAAVPEPGTWALLTIGAIFFFVLRRPGRFRA
jgi:autotransporter-associated beta strand protein